MFYFLILGNICVICTLAAVLLQLQEEDLAIRIVKILVSVKLIKLKKPCGS